MVKQHFNILIKASKEKIWDILLGEDTYTQWTTPFAPGSIAVTDWKKGSKALFTDGSGMGMVSEIAEHIPNEFLSIKHNGMIKDGVEDVESKQATQWAGFENYTLKRDGDQTEWLVEVDAPEEHLDYFTNAWPKAMAIVKKLAEK
ncbi:SRPBCC domain-containing protein [Pedobacter duraquae]|uniref:Activator of Hsp90 ATPase-like protein n=1 Tax=Pedobacter duraquae TaxID=425511 RepID=A0A4R6IPL1_9SPHI|nr:SRPBCC domain-containing protein [Pedobacter duraquae]TDO24232.1 activator of Hsp90 ATPase-like protein [Pedobacter duraquae]